MLIGRKPWILPTRTSLNSMKINSPFKIWRAASSDFVAPHALRWDRDKHFPIDVIKETGPLGMGGIYVREDVGGSALKRSDAVLIFEALAEACPAFQRLFPSTIWQHG